MRNIIIILAIVLLGSCSTQKRCTRKFPQSVTASHDSIFIEKLVKETVYLPGDSMFIEVPVNCPDQDVIISETGKLKQIISILNGKLKSQTTIKPDSIFVFKTNTVTITKEIKVPEQVKYVPKLIKWLSWIGSISIILIVLYLALKIKKLIV